MIDYIVWGLITAFFAVPLTIWMWSKAPDGYYWCTFDMDGRG